MGNEKLTEEEIDKYLNSSDGDKILSQTQIDALLQKIDETKPELKNPNEKI